MLEHLVRYEIMTKIVEFRKTTKTFILWHFQKKKLLSILQQYTHTLHFLVIRIRWLSISMIVFRFFNNVRNDLFFFFKGMWMKKLVQKNEYCRKKISIFFSLNLGKFGKNSYVKRKDTKIVFGREERKKCWYWMYFVHKADVNSKFWYFRQKK